MLQDTITIKGRYKKFIVEVCKTQIIWTLKNESGFVTSFSNNYTTEEGEEAPLLCFWSSESQAKRCVEEEWGDYVPTEIPLAMFLEVWCVGMFRDQVFVGIELDRNLFGFEVDPIALGKDLIQEIKKENYAIELRQFKNVDEIEQLFLTV